MRFIFILCFLFMAGCGGLSLGTALIANTGGTIAGNAAWHKIKEKYPEQFPDKVEEIFLSEYESEEVRLNAEKTNIEADLVELAKIITDIKAL